MTGRFQPSLNTVALPVLGEEGVHTNCWPVVTSSVANDRPPNPNFGNPSNRIAADWSSAGQLATLGKFRYALCGSQLM